MAIERGFELKLPAADRFDKEGRLQLTFVCTMASCFHRSKPNFVGCDFKLIYKSTCEKVKAFRLTQFNDCHCHYILNGIARQKDESSFAVWDKTKTPKKT